MKRDEYISWDQYFMSIAIMSAQRSKDPNTQVGACIVDADNRILSVGYNGMPTGCDDDNMPWNRDGDGLESKYFFVCHAELNAILNYRGNSNLKGARVYVTLFPCNECAKAIIQSGISEIIYMQDKYSDAETTIASKRMFDMAGVKYTPYKNRHKKIEFEV
jgi:dCMP deaminase